MAKVGVEIILTQSRTRMALSRVAASVLAAAVFLGVCREETAMRGEARPDDLPVAGRQRRTPEAQAEGRALSMRGAKVRLK